MEIGTVLFAIGTLVAALGIANRKKNGFGGSEDAVVAVGAAVALYGAARAFMDTLNHSVHMWSAWF